MSCRSTFPLLRDRPEDIESLVTFFARKYAAANGRPIPRIPSDVISMLQAYAWPGNVRELQNYIERATVLCTSETLTMDLFPRMSAAWPRCESAEPNPGEFRKCAANWSP